jgi:hypothetical protein
MWLRVCSMVYQLSLHCNEMLQVVVLVVVGLVVIDVVGLAAAGRVAPRVHHLTNFRGLLK